MRNSLPAYQKVTPISHSSEKQISAEVIEKKKETADSGINSISLKVEESTVARWVRF
jgi:hypothetical protein